MNRRTILAASLLVLAAPGARAEGWSEYRSEDGRTRVRLPGMPAVRTEQISIAPGETAPMTEAVVKQGGTTYLVSHIAYPRRISQSASAEWMLDHFRNKMSAGHTLRAEKPLTAGRSQGREEHPIDQHRMSVLDAAHRSNNRRARRTVAIDDVPHG